MNCDRVFAVLTRGPFPTGDPSDEAVETHLARCAECRRLAEALRPAARLKDERGLRAPEMIGRMVEEIVGAEERRMLPGYWGDAGSEEAGALLARFSDGDRPGAGSAGPTSIAGSMARGPRTASASRGVFRHPRIWIMGAAVALGLALGASFRYLGSLDDPPLWGGAGHRVLPVNADRGAGVDNSRLLSTTRQLIAAQHLPAACRVWPLPGIAPCASESLRRRLGRALSTRSPRLPSRANIRLAARIAITRALALKSRGRPAPP